MEMHGLPSSRPAHIVLPPSGIAVAESIHTPQFHMCSTIDPFHEVFHVVRGKISLVVGRNETCVLLPEGGFTFVAAGTPHRVIDSSASTVLLLCASKEVIAESADRRYVWEQIARAAPWVAIPHTRRESEEILLHWRRLMGLQDQLQAPDTSLRLLTEFDECLLALYDLRCDESGTDARSRVRLLLTEIEGRLSDHWSVEKAARRSGLSSRRFSQLFRDIAGTTFVPWLHERRIQHACRLLATGRHTIAGAALASGFEDLSHFYRVFQKLCRRTPRQWVLDQEEGHLPSAMASRTKPR